jgi:phosphoesterase RecJ-like protein
VAAVVRDKPDGSRDARKVSLRSTDGQIDVSAIARKMGGGGHQRAAGFSTDQPYEELVQFLVAETTAGLG